MIADVTIVVVARTGPSAKSRLAQVLAPAARAELALAMLEDVLTVGAAVGPAELLAVVDSPPGRAVAERVGARMVADPGRGLNAAVAAGALAAQSSTVLVVPGDLPWLHADDLQALMATAGDAPRVVVHAQDHTGTGTNALLLRPPHVITPRFGVNSAAHHRAVAADAGATFTSLYRETLAADLDMPADLVRLRADKQTGATGRWLRSHPDR